MDSRRSKSRKGTEDFVSEYCCAVATLPQLAFCSGGAKTLRLDLVAVIAESKEELSNAFHERSRAADVASRVKICRPGRTRDQLAALTRQGEVRIPPERTRPLSGL